MGSSSGKLFVEDLDPRVISELLGGDGTAVHAVVVGPPLRAHASRQQLLGGHQQHGTDRLRPTTRDSARTLHPDLTARLAEIGSGSTYVIAALDGAYSRYYEATLESEWRTQRGHFVRGSYTWSRYYGNMDQDNSSLTSNDSNIFIGSSNIADGAGRQLWDSKDGTLRGDRPHMFKVSATTRCHGRRRSARSRSRSQAALGRMERRAYRALSDEHRCNQSLRRARWHPPHVQHHQLDLKHIQNFPLRQLSSRANLQLVFDVYNVFDNQTAYNFQPSTINPAFNTPRSHFDPARFRDRPLPVLATEEPQKNTGRT